MHGDGTFTLIRFFSRVTHGKKQKRAIDGEAAMIAKTKTKDASHVPSLSSSGNRIKALATTNHSHGPTRNPSHH